MYSSEEISILYSIKIGQKKYKDLTTSIRIVELYHWLMVHAILLEWNLVGDRTLIHDASEDFNKCKGKLII